MKKLVVFNTYEQAHSHRVRYEEEPYSIASLEEGVGRINIGDNKKFDIVLFVGNYASDSIDTYLDLLGKFHKDLRKYNLVHETTLYK